jgi:hypothetical protein
MKIAGRFTRNYWSLHVATMVVIQNLWLENLDKRPIDDSNSPERSDSRSQKSLSCKKLPNFHGTQRFITILKTAYWILS